MYIDYMGAHCPKDGVAIVPYIYTYVVRWRKENGN